MASSVRTTNTSSQLNAALSDEIQALRNQIQPGAKITADQMNSLKDKIMAFVGHNHGYRDYQSVKTFGNTGGDVFTDRVSSTNVPSLPGLGTPDTALTTKTSGIEITADDVNAYIYTTNYYISHDHTITDT